MAGEFLYKITNPLSLEARVQELETLIKQMRRGVGTTQTALGNEAGRHEIGPVSVQAVAEEAAFVREGVYTPNLLVTVDADNVPPVGSIGYRVRFTPATGAAFETDGVAVDEENGVTWTSARVVRVVAPPRGAYTVAACLRNVFGNGPYGPEFAGTLGNDTTPPAVPTGLAVGPSPRLGAINYTYNIPADTDFSFVEVFAGIGDFALGAGTLVSESKGGAGEFNFDITIDKFDTIKARSVDLSGNRSALSSGVAISTRLIGQNDIGQRAITPVAVNLGTLNVLNGHVEIPNSAGTGPDGWTLTGGAVWSTDNTISRANGTHSIKLTSAVLNTDAIAESPLFTFAWTSDVTKFAGSLRVRIAMRNELNAADTTSFYLNCYGSDFALLGTVTIRDANNVLSTLAPPAIGAGWQPIEGLLLQTLTVPVATVYMSVVCKIRNTVSLTNYLAIDRVSVDVVNDTTGASSFRLTSAENGIQTGDLSYVTGAGINRLQSSSGIPLQLLATSGVTLYTGNNTLAVSGAAGGDIATWQGGATQKGGVTSAGKPFFINGASQRLAPAYIPLGWIQAALQPISANSTLWTALPQGGNMLLEYWACVFLVTGTHDNLNRWTVTLSRANTGTATAVGSFSTFGTTSPFAASPAVILVPGTVTHLQVDAAKTGAPGTLYFFPTALVREFL